MKCLRTCLLLAPVFAAAFCANLNAATTGVVGAVNFSVPTGPSVVSIPFLKPVQFQGAVSSISGSAVDLGASVPSLSGANYIHVLSGTDAGMIFDIASVAGSIVNLTEAPAGLVAGDTIAIRQHMTLAYLGTPPLFTTATLLDAGGVPAVQTYFISGWANPNVVIYPGEAIIISNSTVWNITLYASVCEVDLIFSAANGPQLVGNIDPVNGSSDVLASMVASAPLFSTLTALTAGGVPVSSTRFITGWSPVNPLTFDTSEYKSFVLSTSAGVDIVNAGMVVAE